MKNTLRFWTFLFCLLQTILINGQNIKDLSNSKLLQKAENAKEISDYLTAVECYEEYLNRKPTNSKVGFELASIYVKMRDYENAMRWYKLLYEQDVNRNILALLSFGRMAMASGNDNVAKRSFERFKREFDPGKDNNHIKKLNNLHLNGVDMFMNEYDSLKVTYSPVYDLENVFNHPIQTGDKQVFLKANSNYTIFENPDEILKYLNSKEEKVPNSFLSEDRSKFFFSMFDKNPKGKIVASLYQCTKTDDGWKDYEKLPLTVNKEDYNSILPTVGRNSKNGELVLYFASDRPEGRGGWDIWFAEFSSKKNSFKEAKNLGSKVNTAGNEFSPYYNIEEGVLYFSSDGWPGFGSQDIFWIKGEGRSWEDYYNLGTEINTNFDEYCFTYFNDAYYWTSNRNASDNNYSPHYYDEFFKTYFLTRIREETIALKQEVETRITSEEIIEEEITVKDEEVDVVSENDNRFDIEEVKDSIIKVTLYHEFDEAILVDEFLKIIDDNIVKFYNDNGLKQIRITSYTDNRGTNAYNKVLSTNRAKFTNDYLLLKEIPQSIIEFSGKGESEPASPNKNPDGTDNPEGRRLNRRTVIEAFVK